MQARRIEYRADIDGLRAIAVLAVIFFHLDSQFLPGGFAGVDIFFVISGYLITKNIVAELLRGDFSLVEFYRRRIKRIAPVMLTVVASVLIVGWAILLPEDLAALAKSAVWSVVSLANVYLWREVTTEYFATASAQLPLLHLWSLGVEEQFYVIWPLLLMFIWRVCAVRQGATQIERTVTLVIALAIVVISTSLSIYLFPDNSRFVYYMLPTRAGELLIGAVAGLLATKQSLVKAPHWVAPSMTAIGGILVLLSLILLNESQPFPGWRAIPPTLGAALLILAGEGGRQQRHLRFLCAKPVVWIGVVSYSAYLWHWPVLAYWRYAFGDPDLPTMVRLLILIFVLAWMSYRFVEQPARMTKRGALRVLIFQYLIPAGALVFTCLLLVYGARLGVPIESQQYREDLIALRQEVRPPYDFDWGCQRQNLTLEDMTNGNCVLGRQGPLPPKALLLGDSNAAQYIQMLKVLADQAGYSFRNIEIGSCPPLLSDPKRFVALGRYRNCADSLALALPFVDHFPVVIMAGSWTSYQQRSSLFLLQLRATVEQLTSRGHTVVLLGKAPTLSNYDGKCKQKALKILMLDCVRPPQALSADVIEMNLKLKQMAAGMERVRFFDANGYLCPKGLCSEYDSEGRPRYIDASHLTVNASLELGKLILSTEGVPVALRF